MKLIQFVVVFIVLLFKYKFRVEISRKQKDAEVQQQLYTLTHTAKPVKRSTMTLNTPNSIPSQSNTGITNQSIQDLLLTSLASPLTAAADHMHSNSNTNNSNNCNANDNATCKECIQYRNDIQQLQYKIQQYTHNNDNSGGGSGGSGYGSPRLSRKSSKPTGMGIDAGLANSNYIPGSTSGTSLSSMIITPKNYIDDDTSYTVATIPDSNTNSNNKS